MINKAASIGAMKYIYKLLEIHVFQGYFRFRLNRALITHFVKLREQTREKAIGMGLWMTSEVNVRVNAKT